MVWALFQVDSAETNKCSLSVAKASVCVNRRQLSQKIIYLSCIISSFANYSLEHFSLGAYSVYETFCTAYHLKDEFFYNFSCKACKSHKEEKKNAELNQEIKRKIQTRHINL